MSLDGLQSRLACRRSPSKAIPADITGVNDGQVALIEVVKGLGEYLTSTEDDTRLKGMTASNRLALMSRLELSDESAKGDTAFEDQQADE